MIAFLRKISSWAQVLLLVATKEDPPVANRHGAEAAIQGPTTSGHRVTARC